MVFSAALVAAARLMASSLPAALTGLIFLPLAAARRLRALMSAVLILLMAEMLAAVLRGVGLAAAESCLMAAAQSCACVWRAAVVFPDVVSGFGNGLIVQFVHDGSPQYDIKVEFYLFKIGKKY